MIHRTIYPLICAACLGCLVATTQAQQRLNDGSSEVFRQLLAMPAPTPRVIDGGESLEAQKKRPPTFYDNDKTPPEDAPTEDLLDYWERWANTSSSESPRASDTVKERLLTAVEAEPERLSRLLSLLPDTTEAAERVKKIYDVAQNSGQMDENWLKSAREWLLLNSRYFLDDLLKLAHKVKDEEGYIENQDALSALAKIDWAVAEPLLKSLASGSQPRTAALALTLLYRHALSDEDAGGEADRYRERLRAVASDRTTPARARDTAIEVLSLTAWAGRDEWYLSLLTDETLLEPTDAHYMFTPLTTLFDRDPDQWIPVMTKLVESKDRAVQQAAASCLVRYGTQHPRRDAILPVLRWLSDPDWLQINGTQRAWFMQTMDELEMPESVPGLIWIVENEEDNRKWAARTLAHYKDPRAVPALKKALAQEKSEDDRQYLIQGLLASGGISESEQVDALADFATQLATPESREALQRAGGYGADPLPLSISLGMYLTRMKDVSDSLAMEVLARVRLLQEKNPAAARTLLQITQGWQAKQLDVDMLRRIAAREADAATIAKALERREKLLETVAPELGALAGESGSAQGIAAVLLADQSLAGGILGSADTTAKLFLLACARLAQMPLNVMQVGALLGSKNPQLALAAERYLLAEDSLEARQLLWARHPDGAFITGWRESIPYMGGLNFKVIDKAEENLRTELFKEGAPLEIFALLGNREYPSYVVRVYTDRAVYTYYEDAARYHERVLTGEELARFKSFNTTNRLPESGPQVDFCHEECWTAEFLSLARSAGRRVFSHQGAWAWTAITENFDSLGQGEGSGVHYYLENEIKGLEVLYAGAALSLKDVWKRGTDLRVFVERPATPEEVKQEEEINAPADEEDEGDEEAARLERDRRLAALARARFSWRAFTANQPGAVTPQPEGYASFDESRFEVDGDAFPSHLNEHLFQYSGSDFLVLAAEMSKGGLWRQDAGRKAVPIISQGAYSDPLVTPDGRWAVAAKTDSDWGKPNYVVRFNLQTGREYRVNIPPAEQFGPIAYIEAHGKVLLRRARDDYSQGNKPVGPEVPEFYLLDAATGQAQLVSGVLTPLQQTGNRFLQPTGKPTEYWAAIPEDGKNRTRVGRYSIRDFSFQTIFVVPHLTFDSMAMWVDEAASKLYVVYEGQLLRLPLRIM